MLSWRSEVWAVWSHESGTFYHLVIAKRKQNMRFSWFQNIMCVTCIQNMLNEKTELFALLHEAFWWNLGSFLSSLAQTSRTENMFWKHVRFRRRNRHTCIFSRIPQSNFQVELFFSNLQAQSCFTCAEELRICRRRKRRKASASTTWTTCRFPT